MKTSKRTAMVVALTTTLTATTFFVTPAKADPGGTDILHFDVTAGMTNNAVETNADGFVDAEQNKQGHANNQRLSIVAVGLSTNTPYELMAAVDTDTNFVDVGPITTDAKGRAVVHYTSLGHGHGDGHNSKPLPASLNPVSLIREIDILNSSNQPVLTADLTTPEKLHYLIKRRLSTNNVSGELFIHADNHHTEFRLTASGLTPGANYLLALNGDLIQTNTATSKGKLEIHSLAETPPVILDVRSVALWDSSSNIVLQTQLP